MSFIDARNVPADPTSTERLAAQGLDYRVASGSDALLLHVEAAERGFLAGEPEPAELEGEASVLAGRRVIEVHDPSSPQAFPVATEDAWVARLTVPGGELPMWAISGVTVAGTHRRRGIARAMLEGELRAAHAAGVPVAGLTASEATIYGRFGFAPALPAARLTIDAKRAGWGSAEPQARIDFTTREQAVDDLEELHERTRLDRVGDIAAWRRRWEQKAGTAAGVTDAKKIRAVRATDAAGELVGAMTFRIAGDWDDATFEVIHLIGSTADARAALWRFALSYDLVAKISAHTQPLDTPLPWLVRDHRAVKVAAHDHGWLRVLDVPAMLRGRALSAGFGVRLRVTDDLGLAGGSWVVSHLTGLRIDELDDAAAVDVTMDIGAFSAAILGGVTLETLAGAGRVTGDAAKIGELSAALRLATAPLLSIGY
ncbi:GNAT family N-acetyltransferase [Microbacterium indicum]|uniref:GNAT family N-acetyltransferase n=1 Tax=Microbacterium indicum TaxID=358100 RepID=UPI0004027A28|nr:GNAT family N-acetyltransferase [Microbacterium indicum]